MGWKFHAIPLEMLFCGVGNNFLLMILDYVDRWTSLHGFWIIKQSVTKKVEIYYEWILKLVNCLQHKANDSQLTIFFRVGLVPYLRVVALCMKPNSLFEHKEVGVTCEESMGDPTKYQKLLEPSKLDRSNDGKHTNLVCSHCKKHGHNKEHCH
jgi:hypothetical protein